jgi:phosphoglycerate dehydrogenase-like enzyme
MSGPGVIVAVSDAEIADFLPGNLWEDFKYLFPKHRRVDVSAIRPGDWARLLADSSDEVLVSCWRTSPLPSDLVIGEGGGGLQYVCHLAGTVRKLVPRQLIERGLLVTNWGDSVSANVAECTLMLICMALRRASYWSVAMHREGAWKDSQTVTQSLLGRRVGIHGFGSISQKLVPMLRLFTQEIQSYSPRVPDELFAQHGVTRLHSLDELFATSEVVVELAAATPENHHIITEGLLRSIPEGGVFVNIGRGMVVDEQALIRVACEGRLQIALDVFETEPLPADSPFRGLPNVTLLPHLGGPTRDRRCDAGAFALRNLRAYFKGKPPQAVVNLEVYDRSS